MRREPEIIVLLLAKLDLPPLRPELAIRPAFLVRKELLLPHAVIARPRGLVDPATRAARGILFIP